MYNIGGIPNKFEIFQDFYYDENGVEISYQEALKLYSQMDADTKTDFEKYYKDETGYEIISRTGYNFDDPKFTVVDTGKTKKVKRKEKQADGSIKYVETDGKVLITTKTITLPDGTTKTIENYTPQSTINAIKSKYAMEAYMKKNGMIIDPQWASYSAEEILQMANEGVNIPQEIIDAANSIYQSSGANFETVAEGEGADTATSDETTEKEPFLDLIPKAEKKIRKCNENSEKIEDKVEDLLPEQQKKQKSFEKQMEAQRKSLKEFEEYVREWRALQNKVNNGEALSDSEARRYAEITGMLEDKNNSDNSNIDKIEIAHNLNDINILAALGEKLANETIEIGETLADYTSKTNYKTTRKEVRGQVGFLAAIVAMARGERLAVESVKIGNETKEYTEETQKSVSEIASLMEIEGSIASTDNLKADKEEVQTPQDQKETEAVTQDSQTPASELPADTVENENEENPAAEEEAKTSEVTMEEDFIVNDDNVKDLINEAGDITGDLLEQTGRAVKTVITAKDDSAFAKNASKKIAKIVKEYQEEEARRQQEIETLENENKESYKKLEELTGKDKDDLEKELTGEESENTAKNNEEDNTDKAVNEKSSKTSESDKEEIEERKTSIKSNNAKIAELSSEETNQIEDFKARTTKEKSRIQKSVPEENELLENNNKYAEEIIPQDKERLDFTDNSGETLAKMGKYRIIVGLEQIMRWQYRKGIKNVAKGTISAGIGLGAMIIARTPVPKIAEKTTNKAVKEGTKAIDSLNQTDGQISAITGEETSQETYNNSKAEESNEQGTENNAEGTEATAATETTAESATSETAKTAEAQPAPVAQTTEATEQTTTEQPAEVQESATQTLVDKNVTASVEDMQKAPAQENTDNTEAATEETENAVSSTKNTTSSSKKEKEEDPVASAEKQENAADRQGNQLNKQSKKQESKVKETTKSAKDDAKESKKIQKDEEKSQKQLEQETKKLEKEIKKEEEEVIKLTLESLEAVKKQEEIYSEYESLTNENEQLSAENTTPATQESNDETLATNSFSMTGEQNNPANSGKLIQNEQRINELGVTFKSQDNIVVRNRTKIGNIQESIKTKEVKFTKKTKIIEKRVKATEKKEKDKQKRLKKQLAIVGIAKNTFSITLSAGQTLTSIGTGLIGTGEPMIPEGNGLILLGTALLSNPFTAAAGTAMITSGNVLVTTGTGLVSSGTSINGVGIPLTTIGLIGIAACGVTEATIQIANGNLAAGLISLGTTAVTAATSMTGAGAAAGSALSYTAQGLSIVSSSADLVNNVRAAQGKEANGFMSKVSTVAGVASAAANAAGTLGSLKDTATSVTKMAKIGSVVGTAMSSTSQIITEFGDSDSSFAKTLGTIGGAINLTSSVAMMANAKNEQNAQADKENSNKTEKTDNKQSEKQNKQAKEAEKAQKQQEKELKKAEAQAKKEEHKAQKQQEKQDLKDAKAAKASQKEQAKGVTDKKQKANIENGSSKEYAHQNDDELKSAVEFYNNIGDKNAATNAQNELTNRQNYRSQQEKLSAHNSQKTDKIKGVADTLGKGMDVAASFMKGNESQAQTKKKKGFAAGTLSEDAKKRLRKDKKRIATLSKSYRNRKYN